MLPQLVLEETFIPAFHTMCVVPRRESLAWCSNNAIFAPQEMTAVGKLAKASRTSRRDGKLLSILSHNKVPF